MSLPDRELLRSFISYDEGCKLRKQLHYTARNFYVPKHAPSEHLKFMNANECTFTTVHAQDTNHPYYFCLFTVKSQHVYGDCIEECLDKAMEEI